MGATDGTVVTLPSGVQVAQPLPNGEQVLEYQQLCNNTFALSADELYFLDCGRHASLSAAQAQQLFDAWRGIGNATSAQRLIQALAA